MSSDLVPKKGDAVVQIDSSEQGKLDPTPFATHRFALAETMAAYDTFAAAAESNALKVVLEAQRLAIEVPHREELVGAGV